MCIYIYIYIIQVLYKPVLIRICVAFGNWVGGSSSSSSADASYPARACACKGHSARCSACLRLCRGRIRRRQKTPGRQQYHNEAICQSLQPQTPLSARFGARCKPLSAVTARECEVSDALEHCILAVFWNKSLMARLAANFVDAMCRV